jgi:uracil-DNA glycosylase
VNKHLKKLCASVRNCRLCEAQLPSEPRPIFQIDSRSKILIAGQAPGARVHASGIPFDDASGDRLREWMGIDKEIFYSATEIAILPMSFCYPGAGASGDLPPIPLCAATWRQRLLDQMSEIRLTLVIGRYAQLWHLPGAPKNLTETARNWNRFGPRIVPLPHPSPRNNIWLKKNPWFERDVVPALQQKVAKSLR